MSIPQISLYNIVRRNGGHNHHHYPLRSQREQRRRDIFAIRILLFVGMLVLTYPALETSVKYVLVTSSAGRKMSAEFHERRTYIPKGEQDKHDSKGDSFEITTAREQPEESVSLKTVSSTASHINHTSSNVCLSEVCFQKTANKLARAFPDRTNKEEWCFSDQNKHPPNEGLLLVKVPKAASSTSAGVALRIADRHQCQALQWQHRPGKTYANRDTNKSFLLTSIRDPASRVISYLFFMELSIGRQEYSDEWMLDRLQHFSGRYGSIEDGQGGFTTQFAALEEIEKYSAWNPKERTHVQNPDNVQAIVQRMVDGYDFMLVVDRMDESLVALALLLGIDVGDVLVTSSKVAGSYFYDPPRHQCVELTKSFVSPAVQEYLDSDDWKAQNYGDYLLHAAANKSLDMTIERLGRNRFDKAMTRYQQLKRSEKEQCAPHVEFPCSKEGKPQPRLARRECYQRDFGCGYQCIDEMIANLQLGTKAE